MKGVIVKGGNGEYTAEVVYDFFDADGDIDWDIVEERHIWLTEPNVKKIYIVEANGKFQRPLQFSFEEIEERFEDCVLNALKTKGYFSSWEDDPDADKDDDEYVIKVFTLDI